MLRRIGVFDSGIGGLTVLRRLRAAFPGLDMVYLGDLARVPYGGRSVETITRYAVDDVTFLLRREVDAVVVACGTVSSNSLDALRERFDLPIYGVIDSAARRAAGETRTGCVGVIGTQATVKSGAFERAIRAARPQVRVISRACPLIVPLVENGVAVDDILAETVCRRYLAAFAGERVDRLIMGADVNLITAAVVCCTMAVTVLIAKVVGCTLPMGAQKLGLDPAVMASPFITTIVDALSLLVYFGIAKALLF